MKMEWKEKKIIPGCEETELEGNKIGCLLIHGFRSCPFEMKEYGKYLNEMGFTVKSVLLPGHGTDPADLININWKDWIDSVENSLQELKNKCDRLFVAGLSTGASIALHIATKREVDGIIALAPGLYLKKSFAKLAHILKYVWKYKSIKSGPDVSVEVDYRVYSKVPIRIISELLLLFKSLKSKLYLVKSPVLIIYPQNDHVVRPKSSFTIYKRISSKKKRLIEFKKSYHILTMDIEKEKVYKESVKFIEEIISA